LPFEKLKIEANWLTDKPTDSVWFTSYQ